MLTAIARGSVPNNGIVASGAWLDWSNTATWFLRPALTNALPLAKTTSDGSSWTYNVSITTPRETDTTLTLSDTSFTTHASSLFTALTDTGSTPTGISAIRNGLSGCDTSNTESRAS